ncbi:hypothetical protein RRG08_055775 [Elysia crispata]|uniref:Uncharacterized protein n=1 Tax=Elysia crispata TaxID=231223 RepID=A0AAE1CLU0_9GAST|nr:hypothetical protein RRG08_055775 [Elysia crispata]
MYRHWGPYLYNIRADALTLHLQPFGPLPNIRAAAVALHLQPLGPLPVQHQSGCCNPPPTATGAPTCTISERRLEPCTYSHWSPYLYNIRAATVALHLQPLGLLPVRYQSGCCSPAPTATGASMCTISERLLHWSPYQYNIRAAAVALHLQPLGTDLYDIRAAAAALHLQPLGPYLYDIRAAAVALHPQPLGPYLYDIRAAAVALQPQPLGPRLHWGSYLYDIRAAAIALHLQPLGPYLYDIRAAAVALHLQPLGPLPVRYQNGCCSPAPTATEAPTCTISERLLQWGPYLYDIRAVAVTLHLQPLGPDLYDIRTPAVALHLQPLGLYLYDIRSATVALHIQPLSPNLYDIRAAAVALHLQPLGPDLYDIRAAAVTLHLQPLGPDLYDIRAAALALHLQPLEPLPVRYQSGCCSPAPTATGAPTCTISERMLHWGSCLYDIRAAAVALHLQPLGFLLVRYQSGCCSPAPTATGVPACTISERLLLPCTYSHWGSYLYDIRAAAVALHLQPLGLLPVRYQSGCCSPAPTATGPRPVRYRAAAVALHLQPLGPDLYDSRAAAVALHLQPLGPDVYDIRAVAVALHLQPLGPDLADAVALQLQPLGPYLYDIRAAAVALHLQPLGPLSVRYQSGCCSPAPTAIGALPVRYQSGCCSSAPTATGAPTCTISERML